MCLISVIIPVYNRCNIVGRAIQSVLGQTLSDYEILVIDDASEDRSELGQHIQSYSDSRIRLICHEVNKGGGAARNTGIREARGEYVAFLDSDDEWLPQKLELQLMAAKEEQGDNWLIYCQSEVRTMRKGLASVSIMPDVGISSDETIGDYLFVGRGWLPTPAMLLPRARALDVLFNEDLPRHQDYDFLLKLEASGCHFRMLSSSMVIVHWEDLHSSARGLNPQKSLDFLNLYKDYISTRARSGFVYQQVVARLLYAGLRRDALKYTRQYIEVRHLSCVQITLLLSGLIFGDDRLVKWALTLKRLVK